jgi:hypothetical protein
MKHRTFKSSLLLLVILLLILPTIAGCSSEKSHETNVAHAEMPDYVQNAPPRVQEAYNFAVDHPDALEYQPCYCGCGGMGHISNLDCFVQEFRDDGTVVYDNHASGCGICVDIAQDVMRMREQGKTPLEIRTYIDGFYSGFGPSTDTPMPLS